MTKRGKPLASPTGRTTRCVTAFASYHLAEFQNAGALALELGHSNSGLIFSHYRELVKPKEAERYWNIKPVVTRRVVAFKGI